MRVIGASVLAVIVGVACGEDTPSVNMPVTPTQCNCTSTCNVWGDPHYSTFTGKTGMVWAKGEYNIYTNDNDDISIKGYVYGMFGSISRVKITQGPNTIQVNSRGCRFPGKVLEKFNLSGKDGALLEGTVSCGRQWFHWDNLEIALTRTNTGQKPDFSQQETGTGMCIDGNANPPQSVYRKHPFPESRNVNCKSPECVCAANCTVIGDPEVEEFSTKQVLIPGKPGDKFNVYTWTEGFFRRVAFGIEGTIAQNNHTGSLLIKHNGWVDELSVKKSCSATTNSYKFHHMEMGASVEAFVTCHGWNSHGVVNYTFFDIAIRKKIRSSRPFDSFTEMDKAYGGSGVCVGQLP